MLAGVGAAGPDYAGLLARYLDPTRALAAGETLGANPDRVVRSYGGEMTLANWLRLHFGYQGDEQGAQGELARQQAKVDAQAAADASRKRRDLSQDYRQESELHLVNWLRKQHGYEGGQDGAAAAFAALAPAERGIYARQLFFAELKEGGREYNEEGGPRFGSYLRGRRAIAALFPERCRRWSDPLRGQLHDVRRRGTAQQFRRQHPAADAGRPAGAGRGRRGPAGQRWRGDAGPGQHPALCAGQRAAGPEPHHDHLRRPHPGLVRERRHQRRARRQTTVLYTPPRRVYDAFGNVTLSPTVPSTGAGIGTLAPIPEVPAGDVDLIAPLGTIDAGEAGIRVSGNVNIAALHVVNAANIQVQGESKGIPVTASVNTGALSSASAAASTATAAAQDVMQRDRAASRQNLPSIISVQILGYGDEQLPAGRAPASPSVDAGKQAPIYRADSVFQMVGDGPLTPVQQAALTPAERRNWQP